MYVILTYDVKVKRNPKVLKLCRKYLTHVQKSVFEGFISERQLGALEKRLHVLINCEEDQIAIYRCTNLECIKKELIGYHMTQDNIL
jgi:CRISPR-associated protein Cas2